MGLVFNLGACEGESRTLLGLLELGESRGSSIDDMETGRAEGAFLGIRLNVDVLRRVGGVDVVGTAVDDDDATMLGGGDGALLEVAMASKMTGSD
jgi:hypothetical protein